jgi:hypothetical protein
MRQAELGLTCCSTVRSRAVNGSRGGPSIRRTGYTLLNELAFNKRLDRGRGRRWLTSGDPARIIDADRRAARQASTSASSQSTQSGERAKRPREQSNQPRGRHVGCCLAKPAFPQYRSSLRAVPHLLSSTDQKTECSLPRTRSLSGARRNRRNCGHHSAAASHPITLTARPFAKR